MRDNREQMRNNYDEMVERMARRQANAFAQEYDAHLTNEMRKRFKHTMRKRLTDWWGRVRCWTDRHADPEGNYTAIKLVRGTAYYGYCPRCGAVLASDDTQTWYRSVMFTEMPRGRV